MVVECPLQIFATEPNNTIDFLITEKRDKKAAKRFFDKAIENNGLSAKITIDKSRANKAAIEAHNFQINGAS